MAQEKPMMERLELGKEYQWQIDSCDRMIEIHKKAIAAERNNRRFWVRRLKQSKKQLEAVSSK